MVSQRLRAKFRSLAKSRLLFLLPSLTGISIFVLLPFMDMLRRSLQTTIQGEFCGFQNYQSIFHNKAFLLAVKNTLRFAGWGILLLLLFSLVLSIGLNKSRWAQQLKSLFLFPMAVPTATLVLIWKLFFYRNGIINTLLMDLGFQKIDWLGSDAAFCLLVISYLWKNTGYTIVLWLAGMKNVSISLLEAAKVDGASGIQSIRYVILPELKPVFYTITILSFLNSFKVFREAYLVAGAYPQQSMYLLQHLFNNWFTNLEIDKMSAAAICIAAVLVMFVLLLGKVLREERS